VGNNLRVVNRGENRAGQRGTAERSEP
jgi:hypothetical protein